MSTLSILRFKYLWLVQSSWCRLNRNASRDTFWELPCRKHYPKLGNSALKMFSVFRNIVYCESSFFYNETSELKDPEEKMLQKNYGFLGFTWPWKGTHTQRRPPTFTTNIDVDFESLIKEKSRFQCCH